MVKFLRRAIANVKLAWHASDLRGIDSAMAQLQADRVIVERRVRALRANVERAQ
jgi:hypothetical protein